MIQDNIKQFIEYKGITPYKFCKDLGLSMGYLDKKGAIGTDKYLKIIEYYTDINPEWLLTGKGSMLKIIESSIIPDVNNNIALVEQLQRENVMLANSIKDKDKIIAGLEFKASVLEKELSELKYLPKDPIIYRSVAEPTPELSKK